jgi:hypothetical protein
LHSACKRTAMNTCSLCPTFYLGDIDCFQNTYETNTTTIFTPKTTWSCLTSREHFISKSKSHYDWRSVSSPIWDFWPEIFFFPKVTVLSFWGAISSRLQRRGTAFPATVPLWNNEHTQDDPGHINRPFNCLKYPLVPLQLSTRCLKQASQRVRTMCVWVMGHARSISRTDNLAWRVEVSHTKTH